MKPATDAEAQQTAASEYQAPCADGEYNSRSDLCAQWYAARAARDSADWAYWAVVWTVVSLGLSAVGLGALIVTINQGRLGLERAKDANDISERIGTAQVRAYLGISAESFSLNGDRFEAVFKISNSGQSPARKVHVDFTVSTTDDDPEEIGVPTDVLGEISVHGEKPATAKISAQMPRLKAALEKGSVTFDIAVEATYETVFSRKLETDKAEFIAGFRDHQCKIVPRPTRGIKMVVRHTHGPPKSERGGNP